MKNLLITLLCIQFISITLSIPSPAPYIIQKGRPLNIAHRGLCSILPQNTLQSFSAALYQGADFIELDVVYTKQKFPLVMHDPFLTRITNIKNHTEFATRYETRKYNGNDKKDWWTDTFNLNQLKRLTIKQAQAPGRLTIFDYIFTFPTLDQVIQMVINFNLQHKGKRNPDGRLGGILIEAKDSQMYRDLYGLEIGETILQTLKKYKIDTIEKAALLCPIYLHSFDFKTVQYWFKNSDLPRNYLIEQSTQYNLAQVNNYATGIGFQDNIIWNYSTGTITDVLEKTKSFGMLVHIWTFKDDQLLFNSTNNLAMYTKAQKEMKLDGVITQFADIYATMAQVLKTNNFYNLKKL